ncbi:related to TNA1 - high affinity nicotinic acid plasma membrane permease [Ustilago trichophora]|uniref:Related to TNA1 - high affinity nicotinic acid plasma membrane permease n=1 Tax=Ustilago trichophora TaxID=86804 RepID=A0A5C3ES08_9BASI|nr:related to TNA1 - high affinity nicotinic acid plasma membrane permease [Ustilago trichophora]
MSAHYNDRRDTPDSASIEKKDDSRLEDGVIMAPILTAGTTNAEATASTIEDPKETARLIRKLDWHVLPICSVLYLFSFLDRTAIGNARVLGMQTQLKLTDNEYAAALSIFFALYCLLEVPSNLILKKMGAKKWIPIIVIAWGIVMLLTGFSNNFAALFSWRLLLGAAEAGLFPGITYYLTVLYPRKSIQLRVGLFFSAATIAGAFGGLLAFGLAKANAGKYQGWSFIFFVEGALTILVGVIAYFLLFDGLEKAPFLTESEKVYMSDRVHFDGNDIPMNDEFAWKFVWAGLKDWKTLFTLICYVTTITPLYSTALTLPSILKNSLKYNSIDANLYTVPVYTVAAVTVVIFAYFSDRLGIRFPFICLGTLISGIGWGLSLNYAKTHPKIAYGAQFISAAGSYAAFPGVVASLTQTIGGKTKRSVCIAIIVGFGGLAGTISSNIFPKKQAPYYHRAHYINIGMNAVAFLSALSFAGLLYLANKRKQAKIDSGEAARLTKEEIADMGDESPYFKYRY